MGGNRRRFAITGATVLLLTVVFGCQQGGSSAEAPREITAEERFESVLTTFRRGMETGNGGVVAGSGSLANQDGSVSLYSIDNRVSHEYFPADRPDGEHRAKIIVESRSRFSVKPAQTGDSRDDGGETSKGAGRGEVAPSPGAGGSAASRPGLSGEVPEARKYEETRTYELAYRNGRWELITKIDPETDRAALEAFRYAIRTQL